MAANTVLLLEENRDDETLVLHGLRNAQASETIVVVRTCAEARDYLSGSGKYASRDTRELPGLLLMDVHEPRTNAFELLRFVRSDDRTRLLPVVVLTSGDDDEGVRQCYELGANSYVRKPVEFAQLMDMVRQVGRYWLMLNESPLR